MPWLSVLMTTDRSVCYPEAIKDMQDPEDVDRLIDAKGYAHVGIADAAMAFFPDVIDRLLCPTVVVMREPIESAEELIRMGTNQQLACTFADRAFHACERLKGKVNVMVVHAKQLRERRVAQAIFWHCLPTGIAFDEVRFAMLSQLDIEQKPLAIAASARNNLSGMQAMFKDRFEHMDSILQ